MTTKHLYIILIILAVVGSACGGQPVQGATEITAITSLPPTPTKGETALLLWEGPALFAEDPTECHRLRITQDYQAFIGLCDGEQTEIEFVPNQEGGLVGMVSRLAPFQSDTPNGHTVFNGRGEIAGLAWERAITNWAQFAYAELASGRIGASNRTVLAWHVGEQDGQCQILLVLGHGYATAGLTPCEGGQMKLIASDWVDTADWEQFDTWLYNNAPFYQNNSYLDGHGTAELGAEEAAALLTWARTVYDKISQTAGLPAQLDQEIEVTSAITLTGETTIFPITDETGLFGFVNHTGQMVVEPQYNYAAASSKAGR